MTNTPYYDLNLVEGSDNVNPLIVDVPNYEKIDEVMHDNETRTVGTATELLSGSVHALTREIPDAAMFRFTATANFTAGDTFTVDGIQVTALLPSGESLGSGAYVINSTVLCCLVGTLLTVFTSGGVVSVAADSEKLGGQLPNYYATADEVNNVRVIADASSVIANNAKNTAEALAITVAESKANNLGNGVVINNFNSEQNLYVAPSDGYLYLYTNDVGAIMAFIRGASTPEEVRVRSVCTGTTGSGFESCYIRKGMRIYVSISGPNTAYFVPLVE